MLTKEYKDDLIKSFGAMVDRSYYFTEDEMKEMTRNESPDDLKNYANEKWNIFKELNEEELKTNFKKSFEDYKPLLVKLFNNLYIEGYASVEEFNHFKNELDNVKNYDVGRYCLDGDENNCRLWAFTSTKAYNRNLTLILKKKDYATKSENPLIERKKIDISKDKKEELKDLLNN